jgi:ferrous iron transport protein B
MAARIMPDPRSRLTTILVAPLMSCSARLPVYVLLIGVVIEPRFGAAAAGLSLFLMHTVGLIIAIPMILILNRKILRGTKLPFVMELPPYQVPKWRDVWGAMYGRAKIFVKTAGTVIIVMSVLIWALLYFPRSDSALKGYEQEYTQANPTATEDQIERHVDARQLENSYLGKFGKGIEPIFKPAGFDWRISTAILCAFPAREVLVSSLGIIFDLGADQDESSVDLRESLKRATWPDGKPLLTTASAIALMIFFALCCQCGATLAAIKRETNTWRWPVFVFFYMTFLAWACAVGTYQLLTALRL